MAIPPYAKESSSDEGVPLIEPQEVFIDHLPVVREILDTFVDSWLADVEEGSMRSRELSVTVITQRGSGFDRVVATIGDIFSLEYRVATRSGKSNYQEVYRSMRQDLVTWYDHKIAAVQNNLRKDESHAIHAREEEQGLLSRLLTKGTEKCFTIYALIEPDSRSRKGG